MSCIEPNINDNDINDVSQGLCSSPSIQLQWHVSASGRTPIRWHWTLWFSASEKDVVSDRCLKSYAMPLKPLYSFRIGIARHTTSKARGGGNGGKCPIEGSPLGVLPRTVRPAGASTPQNTFAGKKNNNNPGPKGDGRGKSREQKRGQKQKKGMEGKKGRGMLKELRK